MYLQYVTLIKFPLCVCVCGGDNIGNNNEVFMLGAICVSARSLRNLWIHTLRRNPWVAQESVDRAVGFMNLAYDTGPNQVFIQMYFTQRDFFICFIRLLSSSYPGRSWYIREG